ncbi:MAG: amino acid permease [Planctomycetota bacterium]|nr:amino acid permease [Planctomycetota bacterium]
MPDSRTTAPRFGTFGGVFTPCTLTILGVIMFLRFGYVVGEAGLWGALAIVVAAKVITTLTALSLSAISSNTRVRGGGAYFMISRSLGAEFGGSIGVVFYLAQAISVAMYVIGFTEAAVATFPALAAHAQLVASSVNALVFVCVFIGAGWTIKVQYGILAVLVLSLVSFGIGGVMRFDSAILEANLMPRISGLGWLGLLPAFALFFPAATGIMAGANMSGDLADPGRSIPRGTLGSIAATAAVYLLMAFLLAGAASRADLVGGNMIVRDVAFFGPAITLGIFAATLSSAIGSMMGAPRILQALARDRVFATLRPFSVASGGEPRRAIVVTFLLAQAALMLGTLDVIAPIITMFFMVTYGYLNLATFSEAYTQNPSYRPTFRWTHWSMALLGTILCGAVMLLISPLWAALAMLLMGGLHWLLTRRRIETAWGDVRSGAAFDRARRDLLRLEEERYHPKNWRPSILALSGGAGVRDNLAVWGHWLCAGRGLLSLGQVISGNVEDLVERLRAQRRALRAYIAEEGLEAFPAVVVAEDRHAGVEALVQCHGLGAFRANTVLAGWSRDPEHAEEFLDTLVTASHLGMSLVLLHQSERARDEPTWNAPEGRVDVWWRGKHNGQLMVMLAHLLVQNPEWRGRQLRLLRMVPKEAAREETEDHLRGLLAGARITASVRVMVGDDPVATITAESRDSAVVILGLELPKEEEDPMVYLAARDVMLSGLDTVLLVHSTGDAELEV